jgi:amino acid transporter
MDHGGLGRWQALPLAIGSIAGSGILFLPSTVYATAGAESLVAWLVATAVCVPMLVMFRDIVRARPDGRGIEATVRLGLGDRVGDAVRLLFLAVVAVGLPSGAVVAGGVRRPGGGRRPGHHGAGGPSVCSGPRWPSTSPGCGPAPGPSGSARSPCSRSSRCCW